MRREKRWVHGALSDDVAAGLVTAGELDALGDLRKRRTVRRTVAATKGPAGERLMARLQHAQVELAIAESGTAQDRDARVTAARERIRAIRSELDGLPDAIAQAAPAPTAAVASTPAASAPLAPPPAAFAPTHGVPPEGLPSWALPDPSGTSTPLAAGLDLEVVQRVGDWAQVRASNSWTGWVDGRRLVAKVPPAP
jgi:hypothetical protein